MPSELFKKLLHASDGRDQPLLGQDRKISLNAQRRKLQAGSNLAKRGADKTRCERKLVPEKVVWVLRLDPNRRDDHRRIILEVLRRYGVTVSDNAAASTC